MTTTTNLKGVTPEKALEIQAGLKDYQTNRNISQAQLATLTGISKAHISNLMSGKWESIGAETWQKANSFLQGARATKGTNSNSNLLAHTECLAVTIQNCEDAYENHRNNFVIGKTGLGKTTAFMQFQRNCKNSSYVLCKGTMILSEFARDICRGMGIQASGLSIRDMREEIAEVVKKADKYVLLIDDFDKLTIKGLANFQKFYSFIHELIDACNGKLGTVICGVPNTLDKIKACERKRSTGIDEFLRRAKKYTQMLENPNTAQLKAFVAHYGINDKEAQAGLVNKAKNYGSLSNLIQNCLIATNGNPDAVTIGIVENIHADKFD